MKMSECTQNALEILQQCVDESQGKLKKSQRLYEKCQSVEQNDEKCKLFKEQLVRDEQIFQSWSRYQEQRVVYCDMVKKYDE